MQLFTSPPTTKMQPIVNYDGLNPASNRSNSRFPLISNSHQPGYFVPQDLTTNYDSNSNASSNINPSLMYSITGANKSQQFFPQNGLNRPQNLFNPSTGSATVARFRSAQMNSGNVRQSVNPYLRNGPGLSSSGGPVPMNLKSSGQLMNKSQLDNGGTVLVNRMAESQLRGDLIIPKWINFPHTSDTLLPKQRGSGQSSNAFYSQSNTCNFYQQPNLEISTTEKDIYKMLINRFRMNSLQVESSNNDVKRFSDDRYVDANPMENLNLILKLTPHNRSFSSSQMGFGSDDGSLDSCSNADNQNASIPCWFSIGSGRFRSVCYRAYDTTDERLVHLRLLLDNAGLESKPLSSAFSKLNSSSSGGFAKLRCFQQTLRQLQDKHRATLSIIKDIFSCEIAGINALCLVSDFYPGCVTLLASHFSDPHKARKYQELIQLDQNVAKSKPEVVKNDFSVMKTKRIWDYLVQLASILSSMHSMGLAYGLLEPSKVLIQEGKRLLLSSVGACRYLSIGAQLLESSSTQLQQQKFSFDLPEIISKQMSQDLYDLGRLMVSLCFGAVAAYRTLSNFNKSTALIGEHLHPNILLCLRLHYGDELVFIITSLLDRSINTVDALMVRLAPHSFQQIQDLQNQIFYLENFGMKEVLNGRLFRLLTKLNMCCDRVPAQETSDLLVLRLFLDFVFHQQLSTGQPFLDFGHVVTCLTKLEGSSQDRISLVGHMGHVMLVSYSDVLSILNKEFDRLKQSFQAGVMEKSS